MERSTRIAKKFALFSAGATAALLLSAAQPQQVQAQPAGPQVAPNGVGDLLVFAYWSTQEGLDTLVAIGNAFGGQAARYVHVRLHDGIDSADLRDFTICLSPGDVWTAAITRGTATETSNLAVGNPGSCDATVAAAGFTPPPLPSTQDRPNLVPIASPFGYIEAYTMEIPDLGGPTAGNTDTGGDDTLWGVATPVNVTSSFSSSYNGTAFVGFNATDENYNVTLPAFRGPISQALAREGGVDKEILLTRYTADPGIASTTQFVMTFPNGLQPGSDPVSAFFFDSDENINFSPRTIRLPWEVNVCTIAPNGPNGVAHLTCPTAGNSLDIIGSSGTFRGGWLRLINNNPGAEVDSINAPPISRFPVIAISLSLFGSNTNRFDQAFPFQWAATEGVGDATCPAGSSFNCPSVTSAPWWLENVVPVVPGDNISFGLRRSGTSNP
jgi:hypothetical protein